ncbi:MAG: signal protein PDZ [Clostridium butyricum]|nr:signal protein PDZ [Clostridium butyricum]
MNLIMHILWSISETLVTPSTMIILLVIFFYLYSKNKKTVAMQRMISGGSVNSSIELTLSQIVLGSIGGAIASILLGAIGVVFDENSGIIFLFYISLVLMMINPRYICFSYSGAVLGVISIIIRILNSFGIHFDGQSFLTVDVMYIMMFVGILHIVEGILVMIDGHRGAVPVFTEKNGKILGGYSFKRYWVLPISIITIVGMNEVKFLSSDILTEIPKWWPIIEFSSSMILPAVFGLLLLNLFGVIGYSSLTFTRSKREKAIVSGVHILVFGVILAVVSQISRFGIVGEAIVIIFAPVAHEFMLKMQVKEEEKRKAKYVSDENGLVILEVAEDSKFNEFGIDIGSKILTVNNQVVDSELEIYSIIKENLYNAIFNIIDSEGDLKEIKFRHKKNSRLGIVVVPKHVEKKDVIKIDDASFKEVLDKIKEKHKNI